MEDLGDRLYLPELDAASAGALYAPAIDAILAMQAQVDSGGLPSFDEPWMVMELELMPEWFLRRHLGVHAYGALRLALVERGVTLDHQGPRSGSSE